ncbi:MAG: antitoxin [Legionellales bacterium]|nr:antitoxin [Legionellales bacterium]
MYTTHLRKVGGSVMLAVPPAMLDMLHLDIGSTVNIKVDKGHLVIEPQELPHYTLEELLAQCDPNAPVSDEDLAWLDAKSVGREL